MSRGVNTIYRKVASAWSIVRERGFHEFLRELKKKIYSSYQANGYVCDLKTPSQNLSYKLGNFRVVHTNFDETISWMKALRIPGMANPLEIQNMCHEKHLIYTLMSDHVIVGYMKIGKGRVYIPDFGRDVLFANKVAFVMDTFILEDYRGRKLFNLLISEVKRSLREADYEKLYCHIRVDNTSSILAYEKNGFRNIGRITSKKILWKQNLKLTEEFLTVSNS